VVDQLGGGRAEQHAPQRPNVYAVRGQRPFFQTARNRALNAAVALSALVLALPPLQDAFGTAPLEAWRLAL